MRERDSRILLVEDDPADQEIILRVVSEGRVFSTVDVVSSGAEMIAFLMDKAGTGGGELPDLIFLDLNLPGMSGFDILKELKENAILRRIPVIMLSTSSASVDIEQSYMLGASSYVVKPASLQGFTDLMQQIGQYWRDTVALPLRSV